MGLDFYGIEISARIIVPHKLSGAVGAQVGFREYDLWVDGGKGSANLPAALRDLSYVQDVNVQIGLGLNSKVSITLTPPQEEGLELIHSELINWAASELKVRIGYSTGDFANRLSMDFGGLMMKPDVRMGPNVSIVLNALGVAYGMNLSGATSDRWYPPGTSPWGAVKDVLSRHMRVTNTSETSVFPDLRPEQMNPKSPNAHPFFKPIIGKRASTPSEHADAAKKKALVQANVAKKLISKEDGASQINLIDSNIRRDDEQLSINTGPRNDWWFVRELVAKYGMEIVVRDTTVVIRDAQKWRLNGPKYRFVLKGNIDTAAEVPVYPILEFSSPSAYVWLGQGSGGGVLADVSPDKKEELAKLYATTKISDKKVASSQKASIRPVSFLSGKLGEELQRVVETVSVSRTGNGAYDSSAGGPDAYQLFPGSPEDSRADQVIGELRSYNNNRGIQAEVVSIGIPPLLPADVIDIDGMSPESVSSDEDRAWFNGKYGVMMVEHNIGTAGMITKFKAIKNFFPAGMVGAVTDEDATGGQVNRTSIDSVLSSISISDVITKVVKK